MMLGATALDPGVLGVSKFGAWDFKFWPWGLGIGLSDLNIRLWLQDVDFGVQARWNQTWQHQSSKR